MFHFAESASAGPGPHVWVLDLDHRTCDAPCSARISTLSALNGEPGEALGGVMAAPPADALAARRRRTGRSLTRRLVARHAGCDAGDIVFDLDPYGRVALAAGVRSGCTGAARLDFNVAHSANVLVVGLTAAGRIGVDVEVLERGTGAVPLTRCHFSRSELKWIESLPRRHRVMASYKCWTAKEAFVKAIGLGLSFGLDQVETARGEDGELRIGRINGSEHLAKGWMLAHRRVQRSGLLAIAAVVWSR